MIVAALVLMGQTEAIVLRQKQQSNQKAESQTQASAEYKSDALDELIEGSIFKKKAQSAASDDFVDQAMHAKVDANIFAIDEGSAPKQEAPQVVAQAAPVVQHQPTQQEMGSNILYGAINDLELGDTAIPDYNVPGMPDVGSNSKLYGTQYAPASPWSTA